MMKHRFWKKSLWLQCGEQIEGDKLGAGESGGYCVILGER